MMRTRTLLVQFGEIVADEAAQQAHQLADLVGRPRPVLRAEGEDRDDTDAEFARRADGTPQRLDAAAMSFARGKPRAAAQRPLPSMMMATWRGASKPRRLRLLDAGLRHAIALLRR